MEIGEMFSPKREIFSGKYDEFGWWFTPSDSDSLSDEDFASAESSSSSAPSMSSEASTLAEELPLGRIRIKKSSRARKNAAVCCGEARGSGGETTARSYTPERLVRDREYRILLPFSSESKNATILATPKTQREDLSRLIDKRRIGASQLEALLDTAPLKIRLPLTASRGQLRMCRGKKCAENFGDLLSLANRESPRNLATPRLTSNSSSCESVWDQKAADDSRKASRMLQTSDDESALSEEEEIGSVENYCSDDRETETTGNPESIVRGLRRKIEHLQNQNKEMFGEISSLRKNFQWEESKTGNLTTETAKLRREIQDLRYIDNLVNLLRGQLEEISGRRWPFKIGLSEYTEEVNLVI